MTLYSDIYSVLLLSFPSPFLLPSSPSLLTPLTCNQPGRSSPHSLLYRAIASPRGNWRHTSRYSTIHTAPHTLTSPSPYSHPPLAHPYLTLSSHTLTHPPHTHPHLTLTHSPLTLPSHTLLSPSPHTLSSHPPLTVTHRYTKRWTRYNWTRRRALWLHPPQSLLSHQK